MEELVVENPGGPLDQSSPIPCHQHQHSHTKKAQTASYGGKQRPKGKQRVGKNNLLPLGLLGCMLPTLVCEGRGGEVYKSRDKIWVHHCHWIHHPSPPQFLPLPTQKFPIVVTPSPVLPTTCPTAALPGTKRQCLICWWTCNGHQQFYWCPCLTHPMVLATVSIMHNECQIHALPPRSWHFPKQNAHSTSRSKMIGSGH